MRIVSLLPAATEILSFLDLMDSVVGVSSDCDWPAEVNDLPEVSGTEIDDSKPSGIIDKQVRENSHQGNSLYHVNSDLLEELDPDLVITQEQCDVCAPSFDDVQESCRLLEGNPDVLSLEAETLSEVLKTIEMVGNATGTAQRANDLVESLKERQAKLIDNLPESDERPRVACIEWYDPPFKAGHWVPEMVELLQATPLGEPGGHSEEITPSELESFQPDFMIFMPCGFDTERSASEGEEFLETLRSSTSMNPEELDVFAVHGSYYFSRPGPRLWDGFTIMKSILFPDRVESSECPDNGMIRLV